MKDILNYILEKQNFLVKKHINKYHFFPKTTEELQEIIISQLKKGIIDLNDIDVSKINNMSYLFSNINSFISFIYALAK